MAGGDLHTIVVAREAMGCRFEVVFNAGEVAEATELGCEALDLVDAIEARISVYRATSELAAINAAAGTWVAVSDDTLALLTLARDVHVATAGGFDIAAGPLVRAWGFLRRQGRTPSAAELAAALAVSGTRWLELDPTAGRARLAGVLSRPASASAHHLVATGHAHIDSAWLWPVRETMRKCARTFANALTLMDEDEGFVFVASSAQQYAWVKEHYPDLFERIRQRVAEGTSGTLRLDDGSQWFVEAFGARPRLVIVGAVQVAIPLVTLAATLGYETVVVDGREAFINRERFPHADRLVVGWPDEVADEIRLIAPHHFIAPEQTRDQQHRILESLGS